MRSMIYPVKQLTEGYCCITIWHRTGFTSAFASGEQKKLKRLTLHQRVQGSSPWGLTTLSLNSWVVLKAVSPQRQPFVMIDSQFDSHEALTRWMYGRLAQGRGEPYPPGKIAYAA